MTIRISQFVRSVNWNSILLDLFQIKYSNGSIHSVTSFAANNTSTQLTQLLPYTLYFIQVSGGTEIGLGPRSEPPLLTRTLPAGWFYQLLKCLNLEMKKERNLLIHTKLRTNLLLQPYSSAYRWSRWIESAAGPYRLNTNRMECKIQYYL